MKCADAKTRLSFVTVTLNSPGGCILDPPVSTFDGKSGILRATQPPVGPRCLHVEPDHSIHSTGVRMNAARRVFLALVGCLQACRVRCRASLQACRGYPAER